MGVGLSPRAKNNKWHGCIGLGCNRVNSFYRHSPASFRVLDDFHEHQGGTIMPTLFAVYRLKDGQASGAYDRYLEETKIPGIRSAPWCTGFNTWKIDSVLAPAVSEPEGVLPAESPYTYVAKIEVSDLDAMLGFLATDAGQEFVGAWSVYIDPTSFFTTGHEI
jgi:hypothetical protein